MCHVWVKVWRSGNNLTNVSSFSRLSYGRREYNETAWRRQTASGDYAGQNVFRVPNRLGFTRLNSFTDCHSTDLLLTEKMTTFYNFKMAWGRAWDTSTRNTTDNCWLNVCQDMGRRKICPWQLKRFWIEHDLFWQLVLYQWLLSSFFCASRHISKHTHTHTHTSRQKHVLLRNSHCIENKPETISK